MKFSDLVFAVALFLLSLPIISSGVAFIGTRQSVTDFPLVAGEPEYVRTGFDLSQHMAVCRFKLVGQDRIYATYDMGAAGILERCFVSSGTVTLRLESCGLGDAVCIRMLAADGRTLIPFNDGSSFAVPFGLFVITLGLVTLLFSLVMITRFAKRHSYRLVVPAFVLAAAVVALCYALHEEAGSLFRRLGWISGILELFLHR